MALRAPIEDALPLQLQLLTEYGYRVVSVSELLARSPFEDLSPDSPAMPHVQRLLAAGHVTGYQNNSFHGERAISVGEFCLMAAAPETLRLERPMSAQELAELAVQQADFHLKDASGNALLDLAMAKGIAVEENLFKDKASVARESAVALVAGLVK